MGKAVFMTKAIILIKASLIASLVINSSLLKAAEPEGRDMLITL